MRASRTGFAALGRALGLGLILIFLLVYDPAGDSGTRFVALACLPAGAWLVLRRSSALALTVALVGAAHADPGAEDPWSGIVCPALALGATVWLAFGLGRRLRRQILDTRQARWARRESAATFRPQHRQDP